MRGELTDYYQVLGVESKATAEQIKKSYRELARRYHPDINPSADAATKIKGINEAYHTLGDPERRATYDAERLFHQVSAASAPSAGPSRPDTSPYRGADSSRPAGPAGSAGAQKPGTGFGYDGFGRTGSAPRPTSASRPSNSSPGTPSQPSSAARKALVESYLAEAQLAFINHRYREAEELCRKILGLERRNATAHEILGDIFQKQGKREEAGTEYAYAVQFNPRNYSAQAKLERLMGGAASPPKGPTFTRATPSKNNWKSTVPTASQERFQGFLAAVLAVALCLITMAWLRNPGSPLKSGGVWLFVLSPGLIGTLLLDGLIAGLLLALYGGLRPAAEELSGRRSGDRASGAGFPLGVMLGLFSVLWFGMALMVYIGVALTQNRASVSMLRVFGVVIGLCVVFASLYQPPDLVYGGMETALFAGNLLFPAVLGGWRLGDSLRLNGLRSPHR